MKKIIKNISKASIWIIMFIVIQSLVGTLFMLYKINNDFEYACMFADTLGPIYETHNNIISQSLETLKYANILFKGITIPTLGLSGIIFIIIFALIYKFKNKEKRELLGISCVNKANIIKYITLALFINIIVTIVCEIMPKDWKSLHGFATEVALDGNIFALIFATGILVPVMEEIIFRYGFISNLLPNKNIAIYYSSIAFGLLHGNPIQIIYATIIGIIFAKEDIKQNSVFPSILMHIVINSSSVLAAKLFNNDIKGLFYLSIPIFFIFAIYKVKGSLETSYIKKNIN